MIKIGNSSSLPIIIIKDKTSWEKFENIEKLPVGPTKLSPGPTLLKHVKVAVKLVIKSNLFKEINKVPIIKINI